MARSVRLLPTASAGGVPDFSLTDSDWTKIEEVYGHQVPTDAREEILRATTSFVSFEIFERNAKPLSEAIDRVSAIKRAASQLFHALWSQNHIDVGVYADTCIKRNFNDSRLSKRHGDLFYALGGVLTSLNVACSLALKDMESPDAPEHREGECWNNWIRHLTRIAREKGLPCGVSKGSDKSAKVSPFVLLVYAVQERVPRDARRHHSDAALAKAIATARGQNGTKKSKTSPKKVPPKAKRSS